MNRTYNLKDHFKGKKLEEQILKFVKNNPKTSHEEINNLREYLNNLSEEEKNELIYKASGDKAKRNWTRFSVIILILGISTAYITKNWWPVSASVILILALMVLMIYLKVKFLEKYDGISLDEQEELNKKE